MMSLLGKVVFANLIIFDLFSMFYQVLFSSRCCFEHGHVFLSQDFGHIFKNGFVGITIFSDLTTSTTSTTTTTTSDFRLATKQEYKSSELSSTPAENDLYSSETINVSYSYHMSHVTTMTSSELE